jgi:hypothetical protein
MPQIGHLQPNFMQDRRRNDLFFAPRSDAIGPKRHLVRGNESPFQVTIYGRVRGPN